MFPDPKTVEELVKRIRQVVSPTRIVLFGSAARGDAGPGSDLDVLIVVENGSRRQIARRVYRNLIGFDCPTDVVVATEDDLRRHGDDPGLVYIHAMKDGREVYAA